MQTHTPEDIKANNSLFAIAGRDTVLKRAANTNGGEWVGPCIFCGGTDRFHVWDKEERYWCRQCDRKGDVIDYIQEREHLDYPGACNYLADVIPAPGQPQPKTPEIDRRMWSDAAMAFLERTCPALWLSTGNKAMAWFKKRGLEEDTIRPWLLGYNEKDIYANPLEWGLPPGEKVWLPKGIVIPCMDDKLYYIKIRRPVGDPKYFILKGSQSWLYAGKTCAGKSEAFLFESELDALLAYQTGLAVGCCSIPAGNNLRPEYSRYFQDTERLIVAFDGDEPGRKGAAKICATSNLFYDAGPLPQGKDLTEYFQAGGDVLDWLLRQINRAYGVTS